MASLLMNYIIMIMVKNKISDVIFLDLNGMGFYCHEVFKNILFYSACLILCIFEPRQDMNLMTSHEKKHLTSMVYTLTLVVSSSQYPINHHYQLYKYFFLYNMNFNEEEVCVPVVNI